MCGPSSIKEFSIEALFGICYKTRAFKLYFYRKISHIPQHIWLISLTWCTKFMSNPNFIIQGIYFQFLKMFVKVIPYDRIYCFVNYFLIPCACIFSPYYELNTSWDNLYLLVDRHYMWGKTIIINSQSYVACVLR